MKKTLLSLAAVAVTTLAAPAMAADDCAVTIESNDMMQFNVKNVDVPKSCKQFTFNLKHVGKMPKASMGHNIVISATSDMAGIAAESPKAGVAADYVPAGDARVLAHTKLIGGGESTSVDLDVSKLKDGTPYSFFCSFPGHFSIMKGTITLK